MRGKFIYAGAVLSAVLILSGCTRVIKGPADELKMHGWRGESENSSVVELAFDDSYAVLTIENADDTLIIEGLCAVTDDTLVICDKNTALNYTFTYKLYGDRTELTIFGGTLSLKKL